VRDPVVCLVDDSSSAHLEILVSGDMANWSARF
jgi:hypothetical protein